MSKDITEANKKLLVDWLGTGSINIFGRPFSGKDTQGKYLSHLFSAPLIGGGDIIRQSSDNSKMKSIIDKGELAPQADYLNLVIPYLSLPNFIGKPLILSSLGRWHGEEEPILSATQVTRHPIKTVINLEIAEADVWQRWKAAKQRDDRGNRNDDNKNSITTRLSEYKNKTKPVLDYYKNAGLLVTIDGTDKEETVSRNIIKQLLKKARR